jgi:cell division protein FtsI (penicillin-binding protein 3)
MNQTVTCTDRVSARISFLLVLTGVFFLFFMARLAGIQIRHHDQYLERAEKQQTMEVQVEARRGEMFDRNGYLLAGNITEARFSVFWPNVPQGSEHLLDSLLCMLGPYAEFQPPISRGSAYQVLGEGVPWEEASGIIGSATRYSDCRFVTTRTYPMGQIMAPVTGTHNLHGSQCLEFHMDDILEGEPGLTYYQASEWSGLSAVDTEAENIPPVHGRDLYLTIDSRYQEIAQRELASAGEASGASWGAVVIIDPASGDVLAMASWPVYNEDGSLARNHCVQSSHEPGSVFKTFALAAALEGGYAALADSFDCTASYVEIYGYRIRDSHPIGRRLDLTEVIAHSSNVGTIALASRIPDEALYGFCSSFGFGERTRIDFPSEQRGDLRPVSSWSGLSKANLAIGQEVSATPLQIAMAYGAIANGGILLRPRIISATGESGTVRPMADSPGRRVISEETAAAVRSVLASAVSSGTGRSASIQGVTVAGKTGTAERLCQGGYLSAFAGMIPADEPRLVAVVVFDRPDYEYRWGSALAAPVFSRVVSQIISTSPELALGPPLPSQGLVAEGSAP